MWWDDQFLSHLTTLSLTPVVGDVGVGVVNYRRRRRATYD